MRTLWLNILLNCKVNIKVNLMTKVFQCHLLISEAKKMTFKCGNVLSIFFIKFFCWILLILNSKNTKSISLYFMQMRGTSHLHNTITLQNRNAVVNMFNEGWVCVTSLLVGGASSQESSPCFRSRASLTALAGRSVVRTRPRSRPSSVWRRNRRPAAKRRNQRRRYSMRSQCSCHSVLVIFRYLS